jgi:homopolymeric O-antigen transport system ATP-binding protein
MSDAVLVADRLGKRYQLGSMGPLHNTLRDALTARWQRAFGKAHAAANREAFWALRDVSFEVDRGERLGVIGRNGAGKSTLLKILSRVTEPTEGTLRGRGRVATLLEVGTGFHPELTGRENIYLSGAILGMKRSELVRRFDEIVAFSELEAFLDTPVKRYSSGMYVRLGFAIAAHLEPDILIVDEVLAVGDLAFQKKCLGRMSEVAGEGRTVIFVSHNIRAVKSLCSRAILIDHGHVMIDSETDKAIAAYVEATWPLREDGVIPESASRIGTGDALLRRAVVQDREGEPTDRVYLGEPFRVSATYEVRKRLEDVIMEIGISAPDGTRIATVGNTDGGGPTLVFEPGLCEIIVEIDTALLPNDFVVDIAMHHARGLTIDWIERATGFTALNLARDSADHYHWNVVRGYVRPATRWFGPKEVPD